MLLLYMSGRSLLYENIVCCFQDNRLPVHSKLENCKTYKQ
jgi:hypothetical protein